MTLIWCIMMCALPAGRVAPPITEPLLSHVTEDDAGRVVDAAVPATDKETNVQSTELQLKPGRGCRSTWNRQGNTCTIYRVTSKAGSWMPQYLQQTSIG